jgi:Protein of unknown function (DUF1488)
MEAMKIAGFQRVLLPLPSGHRTIFSPSLAVRPSPVRWDGNRVLFEIASGKHRIACAVSRAALEEISEQRPCGGAAFVQCFMAARARIEAVVRGKLRAMPPGIPRDAAIGTLNIWARDLSDELPPFGAPMQAHRAAERLSA